MKAANVLPIDRSLWVPHAVARACSLVAPSWPLDRFIAVSPFWEMTSEPFERAATCIAASAGHDLWMPRAYYRAQLDAGRILDRHLRAAIDERAAARTPAELRVAISKDAVPSRRRASIADLVPRQPVVEDSVRTFVVNSLSQFLASYFDEGQALLPRDREGGLYSTWLRHALRDGSPGLGVGLRDFRGLVSLLPRSATATHSFALAALDVAERDASAYLLGLLMDVNGWAAWCAYLRWTSRLDGKQDSHVEQLLAIRLAWEWILLESGGAPLRAKWQLAMAGWSATEAPGDAECDRLVQRAHELAWQEEAVGKLSSRVEASQPKSPQAQLVFCIDVRSEVMRRAIEAERPDVETRGFAGFFGAPIEYLPAGTEGARPQLPGLLSPAMRATDDGLTEKSLTTRRERLRLQAAEKALKVSPLSMFSFVEATGLTCAVSLLFDSFHAKDHPSLDVAGLSDREASRVAPRRLQTRQGTALSLDARVHLAEGTLRGIGLTTNLSPLVVLFGHGSKTRNNPHAAALNCGACGGQTGEINARAMASLLNERAVRGGLAKIGIEIPEKTHFLAALHDTTTDEVTFFDLDDVPPHWRTEVTELTGALERAGARARRERAPSLGLSHLEDHALLRAVRLRAADWAEVRPEWGLARNAGFVVAPRSRTRGVDFGGRVFLHDYDYEADHTFSTLELIMTAPMVVAHWINMQYYASTVAPRLFGSGDKLLHNVVGGHIGVFEGNSGDLRIGLPMQSVHDGRGWVHEPLRLSVFIDAPVEAIEAVLSKHEKVRSLVDNGWLHLFQLGRGHGRILAYRGGAWVNAPASPPARSEKPKARDESLHAT